MRLISRATKIVKMWIPGKKFTKSGVIVYEVVSLSFWTTILRFLLIPTTAPQPHLGRVIANAGNGGSGMVINDRVIQCIIRMHA